MTASSNPLNQSLFSNPTAAFTLPPIPFLKTYLKAKIPDTSYSNSFRTLPLITGTDSSIAPIPNASANTTDAFSNPVPDTATDADWNMYNRRRAMDYSWDKTLMQDMLDANSQQYLTQMQQSYPWLSRAAEESAARNFRYSAAAQQLPNSVAQRAALAQQQRESASSAFAREAEAIANQTNAASNSWRTTSRLA